MILAAVQCATRRDVENNTVGGAVLVLIVLAFYRIQVWRYRKDHVS